MYLNPCKPGADFVSAYVSLLRGINVGGHKPLRMDSLREAYERMGLSMVSSYLQSGNLIFESDQPDRLRLTRQIEAGIEQECGYPLKVFLRQVDELRVILDGNPFLTGRSEDRSKLHVTFLYQLPDETTWEKLLAPAVIRDEFAPGESAIYLFCPQGYGKTKLSNSFFERRLGMPVTTRNWNTVTAVYEMVSK